MEFVVLALLFVPVLSILVGVKIVPQQQAWIVERLGKFQQTLEPGLTFIVPFIDRVAYKHSLKERAFDVHEQTAITQDNVTITLDGVIYLRILNPVDASYGVDNPYYAVIQLAQTSMRSAIGKMQMDRAFEERESLNAHIVQAINEAAATWGIQCMRYEIKDIKPPATVLKAMEMQVAAERQKRADILESEGKKQSIINIAEAEKASVILASEGELARQLNSAKGEAEAALLSADATAKSIEEIGKAIEQGHGHNAVILRVAEQYVQAFQRLGEQGNAIIIPANTNDVSGLITQALTIFEGVKKGTKSSA
ncbi:paraslipin [Rickettsiales endosymbiont of Peranema trichophorum]|uniref:SPFH domain-containing protein n=1 Tax=Rickettsiales endosymbiont of Peranema trichophorum TaxID=2486577 RepID=UPI001023DC7F|nr:slipin family protein [Rickettsiales endosymbiont of Peranema trichophorum]RZI47325.1 paraslipin [Rickettsiales endosymbiont of Peranema trichophorum]